MNPESRRYHVHEPLGHGGFGSVYRAELRTTGGFSKQVALKILHPAAAASEDIARRLRDEARLLGLLRHRAIVQVDGLLQLEGRWAIAMAYIDGADAGALCHHQGPIPVGPALEIVQEVASALESALETNGPGGRPLNLLHRDIKPANIVLTRKGEVFVLDFGIAKADFAGREAETKSLSYGTLPYMAPERLDGTDTSAADIYALGVTLAELITGEPWTRPLVDERKHEQHLRAVLAKVRTIAAEQGEEADGLCAFLAASVAYDPSARPVAKEVRRRAKALRDGFPTPQLEDWAEGAVPGAQSARARVEEDALSGAIFSERESGAFARDKGEPTPAFAPSPTRVTAGNRRRTVAALGGLGVVALGIGVLLLGAAGAMWTWGRPDPVEPPAPEPVAVAPVPPPRPEPIPVAPAPEPEPVAAVRPRPRTPSPTVDVRASGADVSLLVDGTRVALPASVRPGTWAIEADFGQGLVPAGTAELRAGAAVEISCDAAFRLCRAR